jgi:hypothetical protein
VTVAEALLTLLQFVLLLVIGWAVDVKVWQRTSSVSRISNESTDAIVVSGSCCHVGAACGHLFIAGALGSEVQSCLQHSFYVQNCSQCPSHLLRSFPCCSWAGVLNCDI